MFVSVIIPVYNDSKRLALCLGALENQTYPSDRYEVLVVDNGSEDDIGKVVCSFRHAVYVYEPVRGSYAARNQGIAHARGEILAFTDSDCIPETDWLERGVGYFSSADDCVMVAGRIDIFFKDPERPTAVELYEKIRGFQQDVYVGRCHFGATANMFTRKDVIGRAGGFDATLRSGADFKWGQSVFRLGLKQRYADDVPVRHPARNSLKTLAEKHRRIVGGLYGLSGNGAGRFKGFLREMRGEWAKMKLDLTTACSDGRIKVFRGRLAVICVVVFIRTVRVAEWIRLSFGSRNRRG